MRRWCQEVKVKELEIEHKDGTDSKSVHFGRSHARRPWVRRSYKLRRTPMPLNSLNLNC